MTTVRTEPSKIGKEEGTKLGAYTQQRSLVHYAADKGGGGLENDERNENDERSYHLVVIGHLNKFSRKSISNSSTKTGGGVQFLVHYPARPEIQQPLPE